MVQALSIENQKSDRKRQMNGPGYYLFLGRGDYVLSRVALDAIDPRWRKPGTISTNPADWSFSWGLPEWKEKLRFLRDLGAHRVYLIMNGFELPYPSRAYPALVEPDHVNVRQEFFQGVLDFAQTLGLEIFASFSTTGHCDRAIEVYPQMAGRHADGQSWQCALCHNNPQAREYARTILTEVLGRYHGFSGIYLHPPEVGEFCWCDHCRHLYRSQTGRDLTTEDATTRMIWFWQTALDFLGELRVLAQTFQPQFPIVMCTISAWLPIFPSLRDHIHREVTLLHWDYGSFTPAAAARIGERLAMYGSGGHNLGFITSVRFAMLGLNLAELRDHTARKLAFVKTHGANEIVYFIGPVWFPDSIQAATITEDTPG
jgi:hypothetical protein